MAGNAMISCRDGLLKNCLVLLFILVVSQADAADPKHCVHVSHSNSLSRHVAVAAYGRPCQRSDRRDGDRWKAQAAVSYQWRPGIALAAGYTHEERKYPGGPPIREFWQQLSIERPTRFGAGFIVLKATTLGAQPAGRLTLYTGMQRTLGNQLQLTVANELTLASERSRRTHVNAVERNILTINLGRNLSRDVRVIASYETKYYFMSRSATVHETNLNLIWRGRGVRVYRDIF